MKKKLGSQNLLYPLPTTLVGAIVNGRPNFTTIAHVGILNAAAPHLITLGMNKSHHTNVGIREHRQFSVNIPSRPLLVETDYCGIVTGRKVDKGALFEIFTGELDKAPLIAGCPVCLECRLERTVDVGSHDVFVGEIVQTWCDEEMLTGGKPDLGKIQPLLFDMTSRKYWSLGEPIADAWRVGKALKEPR